VRSSAASAFPASITRRSSRCEAGIEALSKATSIAFDGARTITKKQAELLSSILEELRTSVTACKPRDAAQPGSESATKQTNFISSTLAPAIDSMKEMAEAAQRSQTGIFELALERARKNAQELRTLFVAGTKTETSRETRAARRRRHPVRASRRCR
jgi:phasin family protein